MGIYLIHSLVEVILGLILDLDSRQQEGRESLGVKILGIG